MNDSVSKANVKQILQGMGFTVSEIPKREDRRTPDFEVLGKRDQYIVEIKDKSDDLSGVQQEQAWIAAGEIVRKVVPMGPRNKLGSVIESGVEQMALQDPDHKSFHVLWLECKGEDPEHHWRRLHATLFGLDTLMSAELPYMVNAYYFRDSAFFRWRTQLDAAILSANTVGQLCVNSYSSRSTEFRESELFTQLSEGICDPVKEEKDNKAMIADCPIDRVNESGVLDYLKKKYHVNNLVAATLQEISGTMRLDL